MKGELVEQPQADDAEHDQSSDDAEGSKFLAGEFVQHGRRAGDQGAKGGGGERRA